MQEGNKSKREKNKKTAPKTKKIKSPDVDTT
jgi:hypothetical protein